MKTFAGIVMITGVVVVGAFLLVRYSHGVPELRLRLNEQPDAQDHTLDFSGKIFAIVVDGPDVYCGNDRVSPEEIEDYIHATMEFNKVGQFIVYGSEATRYGDVVTLIGKLQKRGLRLAHIPTRPIQSGTRLPSIITIN